MTISTECRFYVRIFFAWSYWVNYKNANFYWCKYSEYGVEFDVSGGFDGSGFDNNAIIFGGDMSLSGQVDNRKKDI